MKKVVLITFVITFIMGCASGTKTVITEADELDSIIREASDYLNGKIPHGYKTVFLNINSNFPDLSEYILDKLSENAVNDNVFSVVDRVLLDAIRAELNFQLSGEVDDNSAQSIGKMLGGQIIVSGTVNKVGSLYRFQVKAIEVQTVAILGQWSKNIPSNGATIVALTETQGSATGSSSGITLASGGVVSSGTTSTTVETAKTYKIGDTGPAGGIVFYDKGNTNDDWRYLEVAPANTDREPLFSSGIDSNERSLVRDRRLGVGKENTAVLMTIIERRGGGINPAPWICDNLVVNGFDDWYLPSLDELIMLYTNIYARNGLGGFRAAKYWSSTYISDGSVMVVDFTNGQEGLLYSGDQHRVRAIRRF